MYDPVATERMTPRDLACHRSGLPRHEMMWYNSSFSREELFRRLRYLEPNLDFRSKWQYQNLMYMTAGYLAGRIAGTTWEEFVHERIFKPLHMTSSSFSVEDMQKLSDFAFPYQEKTEQLKNSFSQYRCDRAGRIDQFQCLGYGKLGAASAWQRQIQRCSIRGKPS